MQLQVWWYCYRDDGSTKAGTGNISLKAFQIIWNANISGETEVPRGDRGLMICCRKYRKENDQKLSLFLFQGFWWKFFFVILLLVGFAINIPPRPHSKLEISTIWSVFDWLWIVILTTWWTFRDWFEWESKYCRFLIFYWGKVLKNWNLMRHRIWQGGNRRWSYSLSEFPSRILLGSMGKEASQ